MSFYGIYFAGEPDYLPEPIYRTKDEADKALSTLLEQMEAMSELIGDILPVVREGMYVAEVTE